MEKFILKRFLIHKNDIFRVKSYDLLKISFLILYFIWYRAVSNNFFEFSFRLTLEPVRRRLLDRWFIFDSKKIKKNFRNVSFIEPLRQIVRRTSQRRFRWRITSPPPQLAQMRRGFLKNCKISETRTVDFQVLQFIASNNEKIIFETSPSIIKKSSAVRELLQTALSLLDSLKIRFENTVWEYSTAPLHKISYTFAISLPFFFHAIQSNMVHIKSKKKRGQSFSVAIRALLYDTVRFIILRQGCAASPLPL